MLLNQQFSLAIKKRFLYTIKSAAEEYTFWMQHTPFRNRGVAMKREVATRPDALPRKG